VRRGEALELGDEAAVQAAPLARDVVQVVALLPALQAVRSASRASAASATGSPESAARMPANDSSHCGRWSTSWTRGSALLAVSCGSAAIARARRDQGGRGRAEVRSQRLAARRQCLVAHGFLAPLLPAPL
jgi:hypothetical protein